jgi:aminopeptidase YwaD
MTKTNILPKFLILQAFSTVMMRTFIALFSVLNCLHASSQDTIYARKIMNELCSKAYKGRGYVGKGDAKAAKYIASQFKSIGLKTVKKSYFQEFSFPVNTFPKEVVVKYNGKLLTAGVDYIVDPSCPSFSFQGKVDFIPLQELNDELQYDLKGGKFKHVVLDTFTGRYFEEAAISLKKYTADHNKKLVVRLTNDKLTWSSSPVLSNRCIITLKSHVFDRSAEAYFDISIKSKFYQKYTSKNVLGLIEGTQHKDSLIVFTAHYDHLGMMGRTAMFPGANDNASGVAMMLNLAKYFSEHPQPYSLLFIAFSGEETGLIGSNYYVRNPVLPLENIRFLINIDLMGNGSEGVMAVNGTIFPRQFSILKNINEKEKYLPEVKVRGKAQNSDHYWFSEAGVPCFFFYLMGPYPHYHDVNDKSSAVPLSNFSNAFRLFRDFISELQK